MGETIRWLAALGRTLSQLPIRDPVVLFVFERSEDTSAEGRKSSQGDHVFPMILPLGELLGHRALPAEIRELIVESDRRANVVRCVVQDGAEWSWMPLPIDPLVFREFCGIEEEKVVS